MSVASDPAARAAALVDLGRPGEALPLIGEAIAQEPQNARYRCILSLALLRVGNVSAAELAARDAIGLDPEMEWAHRLRAQALGVLGRTDEALAVRASERGPSPAASRGVRLAY